MHSNSSSKIETEEIVALERLYLYNRGRKHGANAIRQNMKSMGISPLPSFSTIHRILNRRGLTNGRTGHYP